MAVSAVTRFAEKFGTNSISLTIIGEGTADYVSELKTAAAQSPAAISFLPRVPRDEPSATLHQHDVFVFPSIWREPAGLTHLEAMASGLPVLSTMAGGQGEFLRPEENCPAFPVEDPEALCHCLERLRREESPAMRLSINGRKFLRMDSA